MPMVSKPNKIDYLCPNCGSKSVTSDANAVWDLKSQTWVIGNVFDSMYCCDCEYESIHGFAASVHKEAPLNQDSIEAYELDVASGVVPPGRLPGYENGVMVAAPMIELLKEGHVIDTSEFSDEIPE